MIILYKDVVILEEQMTTKLTLKSALEYLEYDPESQIEMFGFEPDQNEFKIYYPEFGITYAELITILTTHATTFKQYPEQYFYDSINEFIVGIMKYASQIYKLTQPEFNRTTVILNMILKDVDPLSILK